MLHMNVGGDGPGVGNAMWEKNCERDNRISESLSNPVHPVNPVEIPGGSVTLRSDLPLIGPTLPQKVYFEMKAHMDSRD